MDDQKRIFNQIIEDFWDFISSWKFSDMEITSFFDDSMEKLDDPKLQKELEQFKDQMIELFC